MVRLLVPQMGRQIGVCCLIHQFDTGPTQRHQTGGASAQARAPQGREGAGGAEGAS